MPAPPAPPDSYKYWRCYMQREGKKYVRTYSATPELLTSGIEGTCQISAGTDYMFHCGDSCNPNCGMGPQGSDLSFDPGSPGNAIARR